mgnify:CR=1 FL=1
MTHIIQKHWLWVRAHLYPPSLTTLAHDNRIMETARVMMLYYYSFLLYLSFQYLMSSTSVRPGFEPLWPVAWATWFSFDYATTLALVRTLFFVAAFVSVFFFHTRAARIRVFLALVQAHALESSFGYINHQWYMWVYTTLIFVFLPNIWRTEKDTFENRRLFLLVIWCAQAIVTLSYTMAGLNKMIAAYIQNLAGEINALSIGNFSYIVADWIPKLQHEGLLAPWVINNPEWAWFPFMTLVFVQTFSWWVMIRTSLQRVWAVFIFAFHIGTYLTMGIEFNPLMMLIIFLFLNSPFIPEKTSLKRILSDLPLFGLIGRYTLLRPSKNH